MGVIKGMNGTPAGQIVELLQRQGSLRVKDIETELGVTTTAVRQQLAHLQAEGLVTSQIVREGVGRPHFVFHLTEEARSLFACHCDDLALLLYDELQREMGQEKVKQLLGRVSQRLAVQYGSTVEAATILERTQELSRTMEALGIMSDVQPGPDGVILREYNCPYHDLSQNHREICDMEQEMISQVLGSDVSLQNCMHDGHNGCEFTITAPSLVSENVEIAELIENR